MLKQKGRTENTEKETAYIGDIDLWFGLFPKSDPCQKYLEKQYMLLILTT